MKTPFVSDSRRGLEQCFKYWSEFGIEEKDVERLAKGLWILSAICVSFFKFRLTLSLGSWHSFREHSKFNKKKNKYKHINR